MPVQPSPAQSEASRLNGALSAGPATPEGRARSALNAASTHGLRGTTFRLFPHEDAPAFARLLAALVSRHAPADAAEEHCVEQMAFASWRERRLAVIEDRALDAVDGTREPEDAPALSLATIIRYRARIGRDHWDALCELRRLQAERTAAAAESPADTDEPEPSSLDALAAELLAGLGTREPEPPATPRASVPLTRQQRRRLEAVQRKGTRRAA